MYEFKIGEWAWRGQVSPARKNIFKGVIRNADSQENRKITINGKFMSQNTELMIEPELFCSG